MTNQSYSRFKRKRLSTGGSYHSALDESDYENDIDEELEEEEEGLLATKRIFSEAPVLNKRIHNRPLYSIVFLLGIILALVIVFVTEQVKNGVNPAKHTHFELLPDVAHLNLVSDGVSEFVTENWTKTQIAKQKEKSPSTSQTSTSEGK